MRLAVARDPAAIDGSGELKVRHRPPPIRAPTSSGPRRHFERH
jgi:hypothetical protein